MEKRARNKNSKEIKVIIVSLIIGFLIGFIVGEAVILKSIAIMSFGFLDAAKITKALYQYKNNIGNCYPSIFTNASIFNNTGN